MYKCLNEFCKHSFEEYKISREYVGEYHGIQAYYNTYTCPLCGEGAYEEALQCDCCNEWFTAVDVEYGICDKCREEIISTGIEIEKPSWNIRRERTVFVAIHRSDKLCKGGTIKREVKT